jgi:protein-S-isoprenylcysteine O-methyltransferase Ste14
MKTGYFFKHLAGSLFFFLILFISAGRLNYWQGLIYLSIGLFMVILNYTALKPNSDLLTERSKPGEGTKGWDIALLGLSFLTTIVMYIIAGLDSGRYNWSPDFQMGFYLPGILLTIAGQLMFLFAQKQNKFFSSTVRIQTEREHEVCKTGLYKIVRHPAYLGSIIQLVGFPLLFGSLWSIIPASVLVIIHIIRTSFEDKTLKKELKGYIEYSLETRYRIIPLLW